MMELRKKLGMAIIMITHDLGVVASMCDGLPSCRPEKSWKAGLWTDFYEPKHEYTKGHF